MTRPGLSFSHFGLFVTDLAVMEDFYSRVLEFTVTDRGRLERPSGAVELVFFSRDPDEHHQIVMAGGRPGDVGFNVINQISLKADSLATLKLMHARLKAEAVREIAPVTHGNALSIYARDPEGNRLELYLDLPWYVTQPVAVPVDLSADEARIMADAESHARSLPGHLRAPSGARRWPGGWALPERASGCPAPRSAAGVVGQAEAVGRTQQCPQRGHHDAAIDAHAEACAGHAIAGGFDEGHRAGIRPRVD